MRRTTSGCPALLAALAAAVLSVALAGSVSAKTRGVTSGDLLGFLESLGGKVLKGSWDRIRFFLTTPEPSSPGAGGGQAQALLGSQSLTFVENRGQWPGPSRFVARQGAQSIHLDADGIHLQIQDTTPSGGRNAFNLGLTFCGSRPDVEPKGESLASARYHFFRGKMSEWRSDVGGFSRVRYDGLYPGVDLVVRGKEGHPEYDLHVSPGADLRAVSIRCEGAQGLSLGESGELLTATPIGVLRQERPHTWVVESDGTTRAVECDFVLLGPDRYGFRVPDRESDLPLVIDPGLVWSTLLGGSNDEYAYDLLLLPSGAVLVLGETDSFDFPTTPGVLEEQPIGQSDLFLSCFSADGSRLLFSTFLGGSRRDSPRSMVFDPSGNLLIVGETNSDNFPVTAGAYSSSRQGGSDLFLVRMTADGSSILQATYFGGTGDDHVTALAAAADGDVVVAGETFSQDFPTTAGAYQTTSAGAGDAFASRLNLQGGGASDLELSTYLGGSLHDMASGVVIDGNGRIILGGTTHSGDFPTTVGAYSTSYLGKGDGFLTVLTGNGAGVAYSTFLGSIGNDSLDAVALHPAGDVLLAGSTWGAGFPVSAKAYRTSIDGSSDIFVARLSPEGLGTTDLDWATFLGGRNIEYVYGIAVDSRGQTTLVGQTRSDDFPTTGDATEPAAGSDWNGFVCRLSDDGVDLLHSSFVGSDGWDVTCAVELESLEGVVMAGETTPSPNFETTPGAYSLFRVGGVYELYVRRLVILQDVGLELVPMGSTFVSPGDFVRFTIRAENYSTRTVPVNAVLELYEPDGYPSLNNPILGPKAKNLPPGVRANRVGRYRVPQGTAPGVYTIRGLLMEGSDLLTVASIVFEVE